MALAMATVWEVELECIHTLPFIPTVTSNLKYSLSASSMGEDGVRSLQEKQFITKQNSRAKSKPSIYNMKLSNLQEYTFQLLWGHA